MLTVQINKKLPEFELDFSFTIKDKTTAIVGPSGSGKTITLKCIAGLLSPDAGSIVLNDQVLFDSETRVNLSPQRRKVGVVFQNYALFPHLSCFQNIAFGLRHLEQCEIKNKVLSILDKMGVQSLAHRFPRQLSAGQQQRVALARTLAMEPDLLLLDEPFSALDCVTKSELEKEMAEILESFQGHFLMVTHNLNEAYRLCSDIAVYQRGKLLQYGPKKEILQAPAGRAVAALTGVKNLFNAQIIDIKQSRVHVYAPSINAYLYFISQDPKSLKHGQNLLLGIRSENVQLVTNPEVNTVPGIATKVLEEISSYTCSVNIGYTMEEPLLVETTVTQQGRVPIIGQECFIKFPEDKLFMVSDCENISPVPAYRNKLRLIR